MWRVKPMAFAIFWCLVLCVILLIVSGCSDPPESGYVKRREMQPSWVETRTDYNCAGYDKNGGCTIRIPSTYTIYHDAEYYLVLIDDKADDKGRHRVAKRPVTTQEYNHYHTGMHYPDPR